MNRFSRWLPIIGGAIAGAVIALIVATTSSTHSTTTATVTTPQAQAVPTALPTSTKGMTVNQIYRQASPGVVDILVTEQSQNPFGGSQQSGGEGAGVVYDSKGDILTDEHVVSGATSVKVNFQDGHTATAKVLGTDPSTDVAVIRVNAPSSELHPIPLANSSQAQVGDPVVAIGSPFSLPETTTAGIVSAVGRSIQAPNGYTITGSIQTDAAINPGNSGGPLVDLNGDVVGINSAIATASSGGNSLPGEAGQSGNIGIGFAIPSDEASRIAAQLIATGKATHAIIGASVTSAQDASVNGAQLRSVDAGSPAAKAGLRSGDVVTAVGTQRVEDGDGLIATIRSHAPGETVPITYQRGGASKTVNVTLGTSSS
jgi:putative serine protease PepD